MDGVLLEIRDRRWAAPGNSFVACFEPLLPKFDELYWVFGWQPWLTPPEGFEEQEDTWFAEFRGLGDTSVQLWRPGAVNHWAHEFAEESIRCWAVRPEDDPAQAASGFQQAGWRSLDWFVATHAHVWLEYTDSTCWELFARVPAFMQVVTEHLEDNHAFRVVPSSSNDRGAAFGHAGIYDVWRALRGESQ